MHKDVIAFNNTQRSTAVDVRTGDVVKVYRKIKEGEKERVQVFEGMVIAIKGRQSSSPTLTVRKVSNGVGVEIIVPMFSPNVEKITLVKRACVRKSKLYYVRDKANKALRFKYADLSDTNTDVIAPTRKESSVETPAQEEVTA